MYNVFKVIFYCSSFRICKEACSGEFPEGREQKSFIKREFNTIYYLLTLGI